MWAFYSHSVRNRIGNPVTFSDLTRVFEKGMNFKFADIYKKEMTFLSVKLQN